MKATHWRMQPFETEEEVQNYIDVTVDNILTFITTIVTDKDFTTATVELVNMNIHVPLTDEEIARDFILFGQPDVTVIVVDSTMLERNLNLVLHLMENI